MFANIPRWVKVLVSLWFVLVLSSAFLPTIGTATQQVGDAIGKVGPSVAHSVPASGAWLRKTYCDKVDKC